MTLNTVPNITINYDERPTMLTTLADLIGDLKTSFRFDITRAYPKSTSIEFSYVDDTTIKLSIRDVDFEHRININDFNSRLVINRLLKSLIESTIASGQMITYIEGLLMNEWLGSKNKFKTIAIRHHEKDVVLSLENFTASGVYGYLFNTTLRIKSINKTNSILR